MSRYTTTNFTVIRVDDFSVSSAVTKTGITLLELLDGYVMRKFGVHVNQEGHEVSLQHAIIDKKIFVSKESIWAGSRVYIGMPEIPHDVHDRMRKTTALTSYKIELVHITRAPVSFMARMATGRQTKTFRFRWQGHPIWKQS